MIDGLVAAALEKDLRPVRLTPLLQQTARAAILIALKRCHGNQSHTARMLDINRNTLRQYCRRNNIDPLLYGGHPGRKEAA